MDLKQAIETIKEECEKHNECRDCILYNHSINGGICRLQFDVIRKCPADWEVIPDAERKQKVMTEADNFLKQHF